MFDCQNVYFAPELATQRCQRALQVIDENVLNTLLAFALYLLGARRTDIAQVVNQPLDSIKSRIKAIEKDGLDALYDRRRRDTSRNPSIPQAAPAGPWEIFEEEEHDALVLRCGTPEKQLRIPQQNKLQKKVVLLSALHSGLLTPGDVAPWLGVTPTHARNLVRKLAEDDVTGLLDKRRGQQEYRVTPEVKAELIQQFVLDVVERGKTSGKQIADHLAERCEVELSERTVREHVRKLGLGLIAESLPELLSDLKKTSEPDAEGS
jgi:transposase